MFVIPAGGKFRAPDHWHSDVTWRPEPSLGSILRAVELPPLGGDTLWADMGKAYDLLDDETKELIDGRNGHPRLRLRLRARPAARGAGADARAAPDRRAPHRPHPPRDGPQDAVRERRASLDPSSGWTPTRARLLRRLYRQATIVDVQCRFRWQPGSVAFWDNRATQHIVSNDFLPARRVMERVTVVGDKPF